MSSVSSISSYGIGTSSSDISSTQRRHRPDPAKMATDLFSKLDTTGKGYIEQSDLETAISALSSSSASGTSTSGVTAEEMFSQFDSDGNGKVTQDELSSSIAKLAESLDNQFNQSRVQGGMPPPPPPSDDEGFTKDELSSQLTEIGSTDATQSSLITKIVENFDKADTNSDGKVSFQEAMAYDQSTSTSSTSSTTAASSTSTTTVSSTDKTDAQIFRQIMDLMRSYGGEEQAGTNVLSTLISTLA